jgi:hypothetical protein
MPVDRPPHHVAGTSFSGTSSTIVRNAGRRRDSGLDLLRLLPPATSRELINCS